MNYFLSAEEEILLMSIIENEEWTSVPEEYDFYNSLNRIKDDSPDEGKLVMMDLIETLKKNSYDSIVLIVNAII